MYSEDDVAQHASKSDGVWVTYKDGVYDVTDWVGSLKSPNSLCWRIGTCT